MNWGALLWLVLLLAANGFFVAAEFAYITARRNVLEQRPGRAAKVAVRLGKELSLSLAAAQLGITMASLLLGYVAEPAVAGIFQWVFGFLPVSEQVLHSISLTLALLIVVFLHMVVGEMAAKNIAIAAPEWSALVMALPFRAFIVVFRPAISMLNAIANGVLRLFRVEPVQALESAHSAEDLATMIAAGRQEGVIEDFAHRLLSGAIVFADRDAAEVMVPRPDMVSAAVTSTVAEIEEIVETMGHSRIPIHGEDHDDLVGFVHAKDLLAVEEEARQEPLDPSLVRPLLVVAESATLQRVLEEMRRTRNHLALVVDEHGSPAGIITLEDIVEELVGEIRDEHDRRLSRVRMLGEGRYLVPGGTRPDQLARFGVTLPDGDYETVGGLVMERLGRIPRRGDVAEADGWRLRVASMDGRRVREVEVFRA